MSHRRKTRNPFYILLVVVGTLFALTAFAYGVMATVDVRASAQLAQPNGHPLLDWLRQHGDVTMLAELGTLAILTCAAIGTDSFWDRSTNAHRMGRLSDQ